MRHNLLELLRKNEYHYEHSHTCPACNTGYGHGELNLQRNYCTLCEGDSIRAKVAFQLFAEIVNNSSIQELEEIADYLPNGYWKFRVLDKVRYLLSGFLNEMFDKNV